MVMGLVNVEHEFATNRQWAVKAFGEWLIGDDIWITNQSHPKFVMNAGLRYYWKKDEDQKQMKGAFSGLNIGKVYMLPENAGNSNTLGFETGYRFAFQQRWFVSPKLLLNYLTAHNYLLVGLEVQLGRVF